MSDERIRILKLVQDGKITPEEALALMEALAGDRNMVTELLDEAAGPEQEPEPQPTQTPKVDTSGKADDQGQDQSATWEINLQKAISNALRQVEKASNKVLERAPLFTEQVVEQLTEQVGRLGDRLSELSRRQSATGFGFLGAYGNRIEVVDTYEGSFTDDNVKVVINSCNGGITIKAWDNSGYKVIATKRVTAADQAEAERLSQDAVQIQTEDNALIIRVKSDLRINVMLDLFLPQDKIYHLLAETTNGAMKAENLQCTTCQVGTTNGSITIAHIVADKIDLDTTNGAVVGDQVRSTQADVETTNGHIKWTGAAEITNLETINGAIKVYCLTSPNGSGAGRYHLETTNGSVEIHLQEATAQAEVHFTAATSFGRIQVPAESRILQRSDTVGAQRLVAELPGNADQRLDIDVKTSHGTVQLHR